MLKSFLVAVLEGLALVFTIAGACAILVFLAAIGDKL